MKRIASNPSLRLNAYTAAREQVEPGQQVNAAEMSQICQMTWANLRKKVEADPAFPVASRGSEGIAWSFDAAAVLDHLIAQARKTVAARQMRHGILAKVVSAPGVSAPEEPDAEAVSSDLVQHSRAIKSFADATMAMERAKAQQGQYVEAAKVSELLNDMMATMQAEVLSIGSRLDPAGRMSPDDRAYIEQELRRVLSETQTKMLNWLDHETGADQRRAA